MTKGPVKLNIPPGIEAAAPPLKDYVAVIVMASPSSSMKYVLRSMGVF